VIADGLSAVAFAGGTSILDERRQRVHVCNETAGAMWRMLAEGLPEADVVAALAEHYAVPRELVAYDLASARSQWREAGLLREGEDAGSSPGVAARDSPNRGEPRSNAYELGGFAFELSGDEAVVLDHLEATLEPFRSDEDSPRCRVEVGTDSSAAPFVLLEDGIERLRCANAAEMIGGVFQFLLQRVRPDSEWMALIHAAAVRSPDGRAIVLPGDGGSGKSTLAAWLSRRGFGFLADDMVALDTRDRVVPWPLPHSIKRGSWAALAPTFPELARLPSRIVNSRELKFVAAPQAAWDAPPAPVGALVFPSYGARAEPGLEPLSLLGTMERLFGGRMWLGARLTPDRIEAFVRWLEPIPTYAMTYATLQEAEDFMRSVIA
jgi:hypothetical protein